jgi:hypothetical protein
LPELLHLRYKVNSYLDDSRHFRKASSHRCRVCSGDCVLRGLYVVSGTAHPSQASRSTGIVQDLARFGHTGEEWQDCLRNRPAESRTNHHMCALVVSARSLLAVLVHQASCQSAHSHVMIGIFISSATLNKQNTPLRPWGGTDQRGVHNATAFRSTVATSCFELQRSRTSLLKRQPSVSSPPRAVAAD